MFKKVISVVLAAAIISSFAPESTGASLFSPYSVSKDFYVDISGTGSNLVVLLQDLHCHYDTQVKISNFLKNLSKENGFNKIFVEGASKDITGSFINGLPQNIKEPLITKLFQQGRLTGAEHFFLTEGAGIPLHALENGALYSANAQRLAYILNTQKEVSAIMDALEKELKTLQRKNLSRQKLKMIKAFLKRENKQVNEYYKYLISEAEKQNIDLSKYRQLASFAGVDADINHKKVKQELELYLSAAKQQLPYSVYKGLLENDVIKNIGHISKAYNMDISKYKELNKYLSFYNAQSIAAPLELYKEEKNLTAELLIKSAQAKELQTVVLSIAFYKLKSFMLNAATGEELAYIKDFGIGAINSLWANTAGTPSFRKVIPYFIAYMPYYLANEQRDYEFAERIISGISGTNSVSAAVIGGFHTEEVKQILLGNGLKVAVLTPKISGGIKEAEQKYKQYFGEQMRAKAGTALSAFQLELFLQRDKALEIADKLYKEKAFGDMAWEDVRKLADEEFMRDKYNKIKQNVSAQISKFMPEKGKEPMYFTPTIITRYSGNEEFIKAIMPFMQALRGAEFESLLHVSADDTFHSTIGSQKPPEGDKRGGSRYEKITAAEFALIQNAANLAAKNGGLTGVKLTGKFVLGDDGVIIYRIDNPEIVNWIKQTRGRFESGENLGAPKNGFFSITIARFKTEKFTPEQVEKLQAIVDKANENGILNNIANDFTSLEYGEYETLGLTSPDGKTGKVSLKKQKSKIPPILTQCLKTILLLPVMPLLGLHPVGTRTAASALKISSPNKIGLQTRTATRKKVIPQGNSTAPGETKIFDLMNANGLGAIYDRDKGITSFGVYSKNATKMELCLFKGESGEEMEVRIPMKKDENDVWRFAGKIKPGQKYGYRAHGPYDPANGHYFNPHKLAVDPYSFQQEKAFVYDDVLKVCEDGNIYKPDTRDSARFVPKSIVVDLKKLDELQTAKPPKFHERKSRIQEVHVGAFTALKEDLPENERSTLKGMASPGVLGHLQETGINLVEVMPIQAHADDPYSHRRGLRNNSGYQTVTFFALHPELGDLFALKETIGKFSEAGIKFGMDVVDNHTGEGDVLNSPSLSYRLLDNAAYYMQEPGGLGYDDASGCGNAFNTANPVVLNMMTKYKEMYALMGVRLFRHDLMAAAARNPNTGEYDRESAYMNTFRNSAILADINEKEGITVAAEGYMATGGARGVNSYFTDNFHNKIYTWASGYREAIRGFIMGRRGAGAIASMIANPNRVGRTSQPHIFYMASHDGHPFAQLLAVIGKDNSANGWNNADGPNERGMGLGYDNPRIAGLVASAMSVLFFANGPVMFSMGDEFLRTQHGNNNAYNQNNKYFNMRWDKKATLAKYMGALAEYTNTHLTLDASLGQAFSGRIVNKAGDKDIKWLRADNNEMTVKEWESSNHFGFMVSGDRLAEHGIYEDDTLVLMNMGETFTDWKLPAGTWRLHASTADLELSNQGNIVGENGEYRVMPGETAVLYRARDAEKEAGFAAYAAAVLGDFAEDKTKLQNEDLLVLMRYAAGNKDARLANEIMGELNSRYYNDTDIQNIYLAASWLFETLPPAGIKDYRVNFETFNKDTRHTLSVMSAA